jgi:hypothetical protein
MWPERRRAERVRADLPVRWEGFLEKSQGTISDLSANGCFILTGGAVEPDELVSVEMDVPALLRMQLWGIVVYSSQPVGFAIRFKELSATEQTLLSRVLDYLRARSSAQSQPGAQPGQSLEKGN